MQCLKSNVCVWEGTAFGCGCAVRLSKLLFYLKDQASSNKQTLRLFWHFSIDGYSYGEDQNCTDINECLAMKQGTDFEGGVDWFENTSIIYLSTLTITNSLLGTDCLQYSNAECQNNDGSYSCVCKAGYETVTDDFSCSKIECELGYVWSDGCIDKNECQLQHSCFKGSECSNNVGSYTCPCIAGYRNDSGLCSDKGSNHFSNFIRKYC